MRSVLALIFLAVTAVPFACADTFSFSATGFGDGFSGSGTLVATNNGDGSFIVTGISGSGVTGLIAANDPVLGNDNLLFPGSNRLLDVNGIGFNDNLGGTLLEVNLYSTVSGYEAITIDPSGNYNMVPVSFSIAPVAAAPEPSSVVLLGTALLGSLGVAHRRFLHS